MKKINIYLFLSMVFAFTLFSCEAILETNLDDEIPTQEAITDEISLKSAVIGLYDILQSGTYYGGEFILAQELTGGIAEATGFQPRFDQLGSAIIPASNTYLQNNWVNVYSLVNASNLILDKMDELQLDNDNAKGSALFFRALGHFDALRQFGKFTDNSSKYGVPISTSFLDANEATSISRSTVAASYQQIISDLQQSVSLLKNQPDRFFVSKAAAEALLARIYLYQGDNANAIVYSTRVINNTSYKLNAKYNTIYETESSPESVLELEFVGIDGNSLTEFLSVSPPEVSAEYSTYFKPMDDDNDPRSNLYYDNGKYVFCDKYGTSNAQIDGNSIIIRLSELYLIRAEALAKTTPQDLTLAVADLNVVRTRSLPSQPITMAEVPNYEAFVTTLLEESGRELGFEGHRWFDIVRLNRATIMRDIEEFRTVYPIPQNEIIISKGILEQNPGYN